MDGGACTHSHALRPPCVARSSWRLTTSPSRSAPAPAHPRPSTGGTTSAALPPPAPASRRLRWRISGRRPSRPHPSSRPTARPGDARRGPRGTRRRGAARRAALAPPAGAHGGNSEAAQACQKGEYLWLVSCGDGFFANAGDCASFAAQDNTFGTGIVVPAGYAVTLPSPTLSADNALASCDDLPSWLPCGGVMYTSTSNHARVVGECGAYQLDVADAGPNRPIANSAWNQVGENNLNGGLIFARWTPTRRRHQSMPSPTAPPAIHLPLGRISNAPDRHPIAAPRPLRHLEHQARAPTTDTGFGAGWGERCPRAPAAKPRAVAQGHPKRSPPYGARQPQDRIRSRSAPVAAANRSRPASTCPPGSPPVGRG